MSVGCWQTEVTGNTWDELKERADAEYERFFGQSYHESARGQMHLEVSPLEIVDERDGSGGVWQRVILGYRADVTVTW